MSKPNGKPNGKSGTHFEQITVSQFERIAVDDASGPAESESGDPDRVEPPAAVPFILRRAVDRRKSPPAPFFPPMKES